MTMGACTVGLTLATMLSAEVRVPPAVSARSVARWMTGPSASGSENGTPTSSTSAPARSSALRISPDTVRFGSPAVVNVTSPDWRAPLSRANVSDRRLLGKGLLHRLDILVSAPGKVHENHFA